MHCWWLAAMERDKEFLVNLANQARFRSLQSSKFLRSLSITSILGHMHGAVNICKKNN
jgi:hypothetical protein